MRIYFAAPLFTPFERDANQRLVSILESKHTVYLPERDGYLVADELSNASDGAQIASVYVKIFNSDLEAIRNADCIFAVLDGRIPDEGVAMEIGYAYALKKRVVGFKSDVRQLLPWGDNPMVHCAVDTWIGSEVEVPAKLVFINMKRQGRRDELHSIN